MMRAKKSLGQNFLISGRIVERIAVAGEIKENEVVLEVGPGKGVLTREIIKRGGRVKAIEKDERLIVLLNETFKKEISDGKLELVYGDALDPNVIEKLNLDSYKVIANIPYYITGALLRNLLSRAKKPSLLILMLQKEVAERIIARDKKESVLSLSIKAYAKPELVMNVSRGNFFPIPNVDSSVIKLSEIHNPFETEESEERFFAIVKAGFSSKRKKLISNLSALGSKEKWLETFSLLGLNENVRAEDLDLESWMRLSS